MKYWVLIISIFFCFISLIQAQSIIGGSGNCTVNGDPNNISDLDFQDERYECLRVYNTADDSYYYYVEANAVRSRWVKADLLTEAQVAFIVADSLAVHIYIKNN